MKHDVALTGASQLAERAREGLRKVAAGEDKTIEGWLEYGTALNEGRLRFPGKENDRAFGEWLMSCKLQEMVNDYDRAAAMWAAGDEVFFTRFRLDYPQVRTARGLHAKWLATQKAAPKLTANDAFEDIDTGPSLGDLRAAVKLRALVEPEYFAAET